MVDRNYVRLSRVLRRGVTAGATVILVGLSLASNAYAAGSSVLTSSQFRIESLDGTSPITVNGSAYRGALELSSSGGVHAVNDVSLDDYVRGVSEVPSSWPAEALKAQAIAARTYALWTLKNKSTICPTTACQVYTGMEKENAPYGDQWVAAVQATAGQVLLYQGQPILAMYSSSDGGHTRNGSKPYLKGVSDPEDSASPLNHWNFSASASTIASANGMSGSLSSLSSLSDGLHLASTSGQQVVISTATLRSQINANFSAPSGRSQPVPSTSYSVSLIGGNVVVSGGGYGHGIGMSQYGALGKAKKGWSAAKILGNYYGGLQPTSYSQAPQTIPVDLGSTAMAKVSTSSPVRVLDSSGNTVAIESKGSWTISSHGGSVSLASDNQAPSLQLSNLHIDSLSTTQTPGSIHFDVSTPTVASMQLVDSSGNVVTTRTLSSDNIVKGDDSGEVYRTRNIVPPGSVQINTPPVPSAGTYTWRISATSGPGNSTAIDRTFRVAPSVAPSVPASRTWQPASFVTIPKSARSSFIGVFAFTLPWVLALTALCGYLFLLRRRSAKVGSDPGFTEVLTTELITAGSYWAESHTVEQLELSAFIRATMRPQSAPNRGKYAVNSSLSRP